MNIYNVHRIKLASHLLLLTILFMSHALAHDPVFALGPHVLFKGGVEISPQVKTAKTSDGRGTETNLELTYGLTGDWSAGIELPYVDKSDLYDNSGFGDIRLFTKYRFWRRDSLGVQQSASILAKMKLDTSATGTPPLGSGSNDGVLGLAYGYESRKWYRWASSRYRINGRNNAGLQAGNKLFIDLAAGIRPKPTAYDKADTVWVIELNGEYTQRANLGGESIQYSGGSEWFISPGIFWTLRNFAVKAGVQIPVTSNLRGDQAATDYRAKLVLEWHL